MIATKRDQHLVDDEFLASANAFEGRFMSPREKARFSSIDGKCGRFLNFTSEGPNTFIYRIIKLERLFELFERRENVLVSPAKWEDPFENLILNARVRDADGQSGSFGFRQDLYGQCWTLGRASDAMWRIYSPDAAGIRMRTTVGRLAKSLGGPLNEWAHEQCFIGKVQYMKLEAMRHFAHRFARDGLNASAIASTLLVKREAFEHEKEVRLLYFEKGQVDHPGGVFRYEVDPHQLIDQLMVDPRLPEDRFEQLKVDIVSRTGFAGSIKRSTLYDPPQQLTIQLQ